MSRPGKVLTSGRFIAFFYWPFAMPVRIVSKNERK